MSHTKRLTSVFIAGLLVAAGLSVVGCKETPTGAGESTRPAAEAVQPTFANVTCPIMGSRIDPAKVTPDLVREFNGQNVAFCCAACLTAWDKLSDDAKQAKLAKVRQ